MEGKGNKLIAALRSRGPARCQFLGGPNARITASAGDTAMIRLWHEQNVQVKSERFLGVPGETRNIVVLKPPNRRRRLSGRGPFGARARQLATDNGRPLQF